MNANVMHQNGFIFNYENLLFICFDCREQTRLELTGLSLIYHNVQAMSMAGTQVCVDSISILVEIILLFSFYNIMWHG